MHHALFLDADGLFTAVMVGDEGFLGWGKNQGRIRDTGQLMKANALVLVEFTLEFFRFGHSVLIDRAPGVWQHRVVCLRFKDGLVGLQPGPVARSWMTDVTRDPQPATSNNLARQFACMQDPKRDALETLRHVYGLFALGESAIPYTDGTAISEAAILEWDSG